MQIRNAIAAATLVACLGAPALAHGGAYRGPGTGPGSGSVPPGTADKPGPLTSWETWWAANKEFHLRLHERMRDDGAAITGGREGATTAEERREARRKLDDEKRAELVPVFIEALTDDSFEVRTAAAIALGKSGDERGAGPLRETLAKDSHQDVRDSALLALGLLGADENLPLLVQILGDPGETTRHRSFAAFALGMIGGEDATDMLLRFLEGGGPRVVGGRRVAPQLQASALVAVGLCDDERALEALTDAVHSRKSDDLLRSFAILSLGRVADRSSLDLVTTLLRREKDANVRRSAAIACGKIAHADDTEAVAALFRATTDDSDPLVRHFAAVALGGMADDDIKTKLTELFADGENFERPFLALALGLSRHSAAAPMLRKALAKERALSVRGSLCIALGLMGDRDAIPLLEEAAKQRGDIWLPGYAALSLGMLQSTGSAEQLRERLEDENDPRLRMNLAVGLGLMHDDAARTFMIETLRGDGTIYERGSAAMSLGVLRLNQAIPDLREVYADKKEKGLVRAYAMVALGVLVDPSEVPKLARFAVDHNYGVVVDPLNEVLSIL